MSDVIRRIRIPGTDLSFNVVRDSSEEFWNQFEDGRWEPTTIAFLIDRLNPETKFVDIGGWIGPTSLVAAALGATVTVVEPDPIALDQLKANLAVNDELSHRVVVQPFAIGWTTGTADLSSSSMGDSMSSLIRQSGSKSQVAVIDARDWSTENLRDASVVKMDIEGAEYRVLPRMSRDLLESGSDLLLSIHAYSLLEGRDRRRALEWIRIGRQRIRLIPILIRFRSRRWMLRTDDEWRKIRRSGWFHVVFRRSDMELALSHQRQP